MRTVLLWMGAAAVVLGLAFTLFPLGTATSGCGNAFSNGDDVSVLDQDLEAACSGARGDRWMVISALVVLGGAGLAASSDLRARQGDAAGSTPAA